MAIAPNAAFAVLVVDSDRDTAAILAQRISARRHQVSACSADAAMIRAAIEGTRFDAVVLDYPCWYSPHPGLRCATSRPGTRTGVAWTRWSASHSWARRSSRRSRRLPESGVPMPVPGVTRDAMRLGMGLAEGLVMSGLIGEPGRRQFDVIGATVHPAARLCSIANEAEIVATPRLVRAAGMAGPMPAATRTFHLRGFSAPVECVSFAQVPQEKASPHGDPHENAI